MRPYRVYHEAQTTIEAIGRILADASLPASRRRSLSELRCAGAGGDQDIVYGSITGVPPETESLIVLQRKTVFVLNILQAADVRPTTQAMDAVERLESTLPELQRRWEKLRD